MCCYFAIFDWNGSVGVGEEGWGRKELRVGERRTTCRSVVGKIPNFVCQCCKRKITLKTQILSFCFQIADLEEKELQLRLLTRKCKLNGVKFNFRAISDYKIKISCSFFIAENLDRDQRRNLFVREQSKKVQRISYSFKTSSK